MKLRILNNTLRFRLSRTEVDAFVAGTKIAADVRFPASNALHYEIDTGRDVTATSAHFKDDCITINVPSGLAEGLASDDTVTIDTQAGTGTEALRIRIEKDFQCLAPRDEDESDLFTHPNADGRC